MKYPCFVCCKPNEATNEVFGTDDNFGMHYVGGDCYRKAKKSGPAGLNVEGYGKVYANREWAVAAGAWDSERAAFNAWWATRDDISEADAWGKWQEAISRTTPTTNPPRFSGPLPSALFPVVDEWYRLCERSSTVDKITISGELAEAIVAAIFDLTVDPTTLATAESGT